MSFRMVAEFGCDDISQSSVLELDHVVESRRLDPGIR